MKTFTREELHNNVREFEKEEKLKPLKRQLSKIMEEMKKLSLMGIVEYNYCVGNHSQDQINYITSELTNLGFGYTMHNVENVKYMLINWS